MGLTTPQGFDLQAARPLELKTIQPTITARNNISLVTRYEGMKVYVVDAQTNYQLVGGITNDDWVEIQSGTQYRWNDMVMGFDSVTELSSIPSGQVFRYTYLGGVTYYRFIANDESEDSFYANYDGGILSQLVSTKKITI